jgi:hypothetical protein
MVRKNIFCLAILGLSLCVSSEYFIEISPSSEPKPYEMKVGEIKSFEVAAYRKSEPNNSAVDPEGKVWWEYDKMLLKKVSSGKTSLGLKAIQEGVTPLTATSIVKNNHCQKKITILITK